MCSSCGGEGFTIIRTGTGLFVQIVRQICQQCKGVGQLVHKKCVKCNSDQYEIKNVIGKIRIEDNDL